MDSLVDASDGTSERASWTFAYASDFWHRTGLVCGSLRDTGYPWDGSGKGNVGDYGDGRIRFGQSVDGASDTYLMRRVP